MQLLDWDEWGDLNLLADPVRRAIFTKLMAKPLHVNAITEGLPVKQPAVSQQLKTLRSAGLVTAERRGKFIFYAVTPGARKKLLGRLEGLRESIWRQMDSAQEKGIAEQADRIDRALEAWRAQWPEPTPQVSSITLRLHVIADILRKDGERVISRFHLSPVEFRLLAVLEMMGPPFESTLSELTQFFFLSMPAVSKNLASVEKKQLVIRLPNTRDRRSSLLRLTEKGREVLQEVVQYQKKHSYAALYDMPRERLQLVAHVTRDLLRQLEVRNA
ncbi:MAG: metalloregulator ArsR/SmtB family transcription factor [Rhodocyclaceae bacterium]|jgi:DNA-binding MarR family transcriptional regulator|nr:metalloregulator ArsR/SmtB family transcription factor [Rhodocyclaceae bacterium]